MDTLIKGLSRRRFLKETAAGLTGIGLVAAGGWALTGSGASEFAPQTADVDPPASPPLVAYVRDAAAGEVVLMVGTREIVRKDRRLAAHLVRCCEG